MTTMDIHDSQVTETAGKGPTPKLVSGMGKVARALRKGEWLKVTPAPRREGVEDNACRAVISREDSLVRFRAPAGT